MSITYREVQSSDNQPLAKMIRAVFEEHGAATEGTVYSDPSTDQLYQLFQHPKSILFVAEEHGAIIGCCGIYPTEGLDNYTTELVKFYVAKEYRGKGVGRELLLRCIYDAGALDYQYIYLECLPVFEKAINMYEQFGFEHLEERMGSSGHSSCTVWMGRTLEYA